MYLRSYLLCLSMQRGIHVVFPPLKEGGNLCSLPTEKANILNRQFQSVFSPKSPLSLQQLCQMKVSNPTEQDYPASNPSPPVNIMPELQVSTAGIDKLLKNLHPDKAAGPDQIPPIVLKELHETGQSHNPGSLSDII